MNGRDGLNGYDGLNGLGGFDCWWLLNIFNHPAIFSPLLIINNFDTKIKDSD
ncbi:hypothetical protein [Larkinella punicea]|uniref:hypothetical protein n=1 Tax=Larkinella punicea TaxID=2315727 RepID=UPI0014037BF9|nr:hypothetical protein [Larkinella punicea]